MSSANVYRFFPSKQALNEVICEGLLGELLKAARRELDAPGTASQRIAGMSWLPHTTRAILTGLRKRGYSLMLDRSDAERGAAYRIAVNTTAHKATAAVVGIEVDSLATAAAEGASEDCAAPSQSASAKTARCSGSTRTSRAA